MTAVVEVRGLTVSFGSVMAVDGFDLTRRRRLLGGAGRAQRRRQVDHPARPGRRAAAHAADPWSSTARTPSRHPDRVREIVGYCPDVGGLIPRATPWEHLALAARLRGLDPSWTDRATDLLDRFDLLAAADRITAGFSHGMGRRMSVVLAAFHEPKVLLLDEPFDGVDPLGVEATLELIRELRATRRGRPRLHPPARPRGAGLRRGRGAAARAGGRRRPGDRAGRARGRRALPRAAGVRRPRGQLGALVALRWRMVRRPSARFGLGLGRLACSPRSASQRPGGPAALPTETAFDLALLGPTLYLAFAVLAVLAPLTAGGGNELYPSEQLTAFPVRAAHLVRGLAAARSAEPRLGRPGDRPGRGDQPGRRTAPPGRSRGWRPSCSSSSP